MVFIFQDRKYKLFMQVLNILIVDTENVLCLQMWFELYVGRALNSQRQRAIDVNRAIEISAMIVFLSLSAKTLRVVESSVLKVLYVLFILGY